MTILSDNIVTSGRTFGGTDSPLIVFAGGGTAGHLFPALAVADAWRRICPEARFVFFVTDRPIDREVLSACDHEYVVQEIKPPTGRPWRWPALVRAWRRSAGCCRAFLAASRPAVVVGTGAYASVPAVLEAVRLRIPTALLNPDAMPGRANRLLASRVSRVFVQWEQTVTRLPRRSVAEVTGCPIRAEFAAAARPNAHAMFGLSPGLRTLLVTGASQGARSINQAFVHLAPSLQAVQGWQVLHLTGRADLSMVQGAYERNNVAARCLPFTDRMADAMSVAHLVVSRAGASTLAELTGRGKPSILVPYPHDRGGHQFANAEVLASKDAARICRDLIDGARTAASLRSDLFELMNDDVTLVRIAGNAARMGKPSAADAVARNIAEMLGRVVLTDGCRS